MNGERTSSHISTPFSTATDAATFLFSITKLIRAYKSINVKPVIHIMLATKITTCIGFTLDVIYGVKFFSITGFTVLSIITTPDFIRGVCDNAIFSGTTFPLGKRLNALSNENGQISLTPTSPHKRHDIHLGALRNNALVIITAMMSRDALRVRLRIFKNTVLKTHPSSLNASIIRWISSTSSLESFLFAVNAAIKEGKDPLYESSIICSLFAA